MAGILKAVAEGDITPEEASRVASIVEIYQKPWERLSLKHDCRHWNKFQILGVHEMKNQKKRLDKLSADLPPKERSIAILDAVRRNDMPTAIALQEATPRKSYRGPDGAVRQCGGELISTV